MTKTEALNMSYDEWQAILDPDHWEYLDHMENINGFDISDMECCWFAFQEEMNLQEKDLENHFNRVSKEEAWELYEGRTPCQVREDQIDELKEDLYNKHTLQIMDWHHIKPVSDPYWKQCVNTIEKKLK